MPNEIYKIVFATSNSCSGSLSSSFSGSAMLNSSITLSKVTIFIRCSAISCHVSEARLSSSFSWDSSMTVPGINIEMDSRRIGRKGALTILNSYVVKLLTDVQRSESAKSCAGEKE
jgi:hypothetical protein